MKQGDKQKKVELNTIIEGDCLEVMRGFPDKCIDLTVTSPPYDNLRTYNGYTFDFEGIAKELYRVTKDGGVVVWVVGDATIKGSETGTSFKQALYFKEIGFNLHDTMIYQKSTCYAHDPRNKRYKMMFEYMFVFSKGKPNTYNEIQDVKNKSAGKKFKSSCGRTKTGKKRIGEFIIKDFQARSNIWKYNIGSAVSSDKIAFSHSAIFPEQLANDHIISWSNEGDIVLDPMCGSGTTCKMAQINNRNYIGIDISKEYCEIARNRINSLQPKLV